ALGMDDEQVDLAPVAEFLLTAMSAAVLPSFAGRHGRVDVSLEGTPVQEWRFELHSGTGGPDDGGEPDARITAPAHSFILGAPGGLRDAAGGVGGPAEVPGHAVREVDGHQHVVQLLHRSEDALALLDVAPAKTVEDRASPLPDRFAHPVQIRSELDPEVVR